MILEQQLRTLFEHLALRDGLEGSDLIVGFGVDDMRVPQHCAALWKTGWADRLLFTGGIGGGSGTLSMPEAVAFRDEAINAGVPNARIWIEPDSTNTGENVDFSLRLLNEKRVEPRAMILVAQPHRQRRVWLTCRKWMPETRLINSPPESNFENELARFDSVASAAESFKGEVERIVAYGARGFVEKEEVPFEILRACGMDGQQG